MVDPLSTWRIGYQVMVKIYSWMIYLDNVCTVFTYIIYIYILQYTQRGFSEAKQFFYRHFLRWPSKSAFLSHFLVFFGCIVQFETRPFKKRFTPQLEELDANKNNHHQPADMIFLEETLQEIHLLAHGSCWELSDLSFFPRGSKQNKLHAQPGTKKRWETSL